MLILCLSLPTKKNKYKTWKEKSILTNFETQPKRTHHFPPSNETPTLYLVKPNVERDWFRWKLLWGRRGVWPSEGGERKLLQGAWNGLMEYDRVGNIVKRETMQMTKFSVVSNSVFYYKEGRNV